MLIFDEHNDPLILDSIHTPTITDHFWVLDLQQKDFSLTQLLVLEEIVAASIQLVVLGFSFILPANWNILVIDSETQQLDVVEARHVAGKEFTAFIYGPDKNRHEMAVISVNDYFPHKHNIAPSLFKHQMLCHPVAENTWVNVSPSDGYNKYLKDCVAGNIT